MIRRPAIPPLLAALACAMLGTLVYVLFTQVGVFERLDHDVLAGFLSIREDPSAWDRASSVAGFGDPGPVVLITLGIVAVGILGGRPRAALAAVVAVAGASVTSQLLKPVLAVDRLQPTYVQIDAASWPSGHTTGVMSLCLALVLVAPPRLRPLAAIVGGGLTVGVVDGLLIAGWHFPSDVLGGLLNSTFWACLAAGLLGVGAERQVGLKTVLGASAVGVVGAVAASFVALRVLAGGALTGYAETHTTFLVGSVLIAAGAVALALALPYTLGTPGRLRAQR